MGRKRKTDEPTFKPLATDMTLRGNGLTIPSASVAVYESMRSNASNEKLTDEKIQEYIDKMPPAIPPPLANYGADEKPRQCIHCASRNTRVNKTRTTGRVTLRHRNCLKCGKLFTTREVAP